MRRYKNPYTPKAFWFLAIVVVLELVVVFRPLSALTPRVSSLSASSGPAASLPWPAYGQSALGAQSFGVLATHGSQTAVPIASVAKVITALAVLQKKPLDVGQPGPNLTLSQADVDSYHSYASQNGSVIPVTVGEQISERQALEAMMLPSANNMADTLATWAFGSVKNYSDFANDMVKTLGLSQTHVVDASGFSPSTVSTAQDLVKLGLAALGNQTLAGVVNEPQAILPIAGTVYNTNFWLGRDGVIGIKTGDTDQAGGCYLFATKKVVQNQSLTIVGAVVGAADLNVALNDGRSLANASSQGFTTVTAVKTGQTAAVYTSAWGAQATAVAQKDLSLLVWKGQTINLKIDAKNLRPPINSQATAGSIKATSPSASTSTNLVIRTALPKPSIFWRLLHP